jgi:N4-(beta-N-acetylglucosaminyl)-L-asparaginase
LKLIKSWIKVGWLEFMHTVGGKMKYKFSRRDFLKAGMGAGAAAVLGGGKLTASNNPEAGKMVVIASGNGIRAVDKAIELIKTGADPLDAVIAGVNIVEEDPEDMSVGYGGLPNEEMEVELDASVMHGPTHNAGAVAGLKHIKTPSKVAKLVMERTDHALLAGPGALKFAKAHGFKEENILTDKARERWLRWKERLSDRDDWFPPDEEMDEEMQEVLVYHGTINCCALVGAAGSTGRGEANILNCGSFTVVEFMRQGLSPQEACIKSLERIVETSKLQPRLVDKEGKPLFDLSFYAVNKSGEYGSARIWSEGRFAVHDGKTSRLEEAAFLFKRERRR